MDCLAGRAYLEITLGQGTCPRPWRIIAGPLVSMNSPLGQATVRHPIRWILRHGTTKTETKAESICNTMVLYTIIFILSAAPATQLTGCKEIYELPDGGGDPQLKQQVVKIQKVIRKKSLSIHAVLFNPPPIEKLSVTVEPTKHLRSRPE